MHSLGPVRTLWPWCLPTLRGEAWMKLMHGFFTWVSYLLHISHCFLLAEPVGSALSYATASILEVNFHRMKSKPHSLSQTCTLHRCHVWYIPTVCVYLRWEGSSRWNDLRRTEIGVQWLSMNTMTFSWSQLPPSSAIHIVFFAILYYSPLSFWLQWQSYPSFLYRLNRKPNRCDILPMLALSVFGRLQRLLWVGGQLLLLMCCWVVKPCERYCRSAGAKGIGVRGHAGNTMATVL